MPEKDSAVYAVPQACAERPHEARHEARRSRFLAQSFRAKSPQEARRGIEIIKSRFRDADHNCWAFVASAPGDTARIGASDDGEPAGTAGRPILNILLHSGIGEIALVVTRWFGGVKLGTGGLARAYQESALANLRELPRVTRAPMRRGRARVAYALLEPLNRILARNGAKTVAEHYADLAELEFEAPLATCEALAAEAARMSGGAVKIDFSA